MPKFAVYYVSPPNEFYHLGTSIIGYDLRTCQYTEMTQQLQTQLDYDPSWNQKTRTFGFHCTVGCSLDFDYAQLHAIEQEIEDLLTCFNPDNPFLLHQAETPIVFWGQDPQGVVIHYEANTYLQILHTLITARMQPFGTNSRYLRAYLENPEQYHQHPFKARKILKFYYHPYILDDYTPHFTLFNPYTGKNQATIDQCLTTLFQPYQTIQVNSICLVIQRNDDAPYEIYREFHRDSVSLRD
jgi:2'-5' RNA ligase